MQKESGLKKMSKEKLNMERLWFVNEQDDVLGGTYRYIADKELEAIHREVGVIIIR